MPRVTVTAQALGASGFPPVLPLPANSADITFAASDATNKEQVVHTERIALIFRNTGAGARTVTITSVAYLGRTGDITGYSIGAGETAILGPFPAAGFRQSNSYLYWEAEHAEVLYAAVVLPS